MVRRVFALGCSLALFGAVSVATAADSPTTQPIPQDTGRPGLRGGFGGGFGAMRRQGGFGGGGMARNGAGPQGEDDGPGPGPRGGRPFGRGGFGAMGGGFGPGGGGASGGNGAPGSNGLGRPGLGRSFGGGGTTSNPQGRDLRSSHPFLARLDAWLMAVHRELMQEEDGQPGPGMGDRRGPQQGPMGRFRGEPERRFEEMRRARMARRWEEFQRDRWFGERGRGRFDRGMWGREPFPRRFGPFGAEERRGEFGRYFGRMYDDREMRRPGLGGGPPPRGGFFGRGGFGPGDGYGGGFGHFGPEERRLPMMERDDRLGPPARSGGFGGGRGAWTERGGPDREEGFRPRLGNDNRFDDGRGFAPQERGPRGRPSDNRERQRRCTSAAPRSITLCLFIAHVQEFGSQDLLRFSLPSESPIDRRAGFVDAFVAPGDGCQSEEQKKNSHVISSRTTA